MAFAAAHGVPKGDAADFVAALSEALANAIEHSQSKDIEVSCALVDDECLVATVVDHGVGFAADPHGRPSLPDPLAERGRGLPLMRRFTDDVAVRSVPGKGTAVVLSRHLRGRKLSGDSSQAIAG